MRNYTCADCGQDDIDVSTCDTCTRLICPPCIKMASGMWGVCRWCYDDPMKLRELLEHDYRAIMRMSAAPVASPVPCSPTEG